MITLQANGRVYRACGLTMLMLELLARDPDLNALFAFWGKRSDLIKLLWVGWSGPLAAASRRFK